MKKLEDDMDLQKIIMKICTAMILGATLLSGCSYINKKLNLKDDNVFEEVIEFQIMEQTGMDIDLTPETTE